MNKMKITADGFVWLIVNDFAKEMYQTQILTPLYTLYEDDSEALIETWDDLNLTLEKGLDIGIEVGTLGTVREIMNKKGDSRKFYTDKAFLKYVQELYTKNESGNIYPNKIHFMPENISNATEYIVEYCPELILHEI